ncbi:uncharacterized protein F5147DRAFT_744666 [Suillus discolor]|uniref:Uncharacterized protein n=1 Tax=Suillus discolor TaxID=1912936 RepID=A0A9P7JW94_9AGAM|nr:uncharacterized protein F5147DRAFT_744666 [Suillus discolor]KAG2112020.1 hypothetical protein F5147DRAFT_744666 [Suillus discolor]
MASVLTDPIPQKPIKEEDPEHFIPLDLSGKNIIIHYNEFEAKGVRGTHVVAVNDVFVGHVLAHILSRPIRRAWKEKLAPQGTVVRFIVDDKGEFTSSRYVIVTQDGKVNFITVEEQSANITSTAENVVITQL